MTDPIPNIPGTFEEEWDAWAKQITEAIHAGYLDLHLKVIAEECVKRNGRLVKGTATTRKPAMSPPMPVYMPSAASQTAQQPVDAATTQAPAPKPAKRVSGRRKSSFHSDPTFRYVDGRLYNRSEVIGRMMVFRDGGVNYFLTVRGVGPKAAKVEFSDSIGNKVADPNYVPANYRDANSKTGIKDPIFMGLRIIQPIIDDIEPVQES